jgi:hypothetical protein
MVANDKDVANDPPSEKKVTSHINFASPIFNFSLLPDFDLKNGFTSKSVKN